MAIKFLVAIVMAIVMASIGYLLIWVITLPNKPMMIFRHCIRRTFVTLINMITGTISLPVWTLLDLIDIWTGANTADKYSSFVIRKIFLD